MVKITLICYGGIKESYLREGIAEFKKRIGSYFNLEILETKGEGSEDNKKVAAWLTSLARTYKIALCVEGVVLSSEELACKISTISQENSHIIFLIGPSHGLSEEEKVLCDFRLSFSRMTFTHQIMRFILLEQLYRAGSILNNGKYHK